MGIFDENTKTGQDFERILVDGSAEELNELKAWLFKENIRLETERNELKRLEEKFLKEKQQFRTEMEEVNRQHSRKLNINYSEQSTHCSC